MKKNNGYLTTGIYRATVYNSDVEQMDKPLLTKDLDEVFGLYKKMSNKFIFDHVGVTTLLVHPFEKPRWRFMFVLSDNENGKYQNRVD